jgi:dsDNA-specific endonuclease/ATPase MutS2
MIMMSTSFFAAEIDSNAPVIDLHGMQISDALTFMEQELYDISRSDYGYAKIIHGIGTGRLRDAIHEALERNPMIHEYKVEEHGGSTIVIF